MGDSFGKSTMTPPGPRCTLQRGQTGANLPSPRRQVRQPGQKKRGGCAKDAEEVIIRGPSAAGWTMERIVHFQRTARMDVRAFEFQSRMAGANYEFA